MVSDENIPVISKTIVKMHFDSQANIPHTYSTKDYQGQHYLAVEKQTARFLKRYLTGEIKLSDDALEILPVFFNILKHSGFAEIKKFYKPAHAKMKQDFILLHKKQHFKQSLLQTQFNILQKKKQAAQLSSKDLLIIAEMLDGDLPYSTTRLKNKLRSLAMLRIENILKGKTPQDEEAIQLAHRFSPYKQLNALKNKPFLDNAQIPEPEPEAKEKDFSLGNYLKKKVKALSSMRQKIFTAPVFLKKVWRKTKKITIAAGITALGLLGGKTIYKQAADFLHNEDFSTERTPTADSIWVIHPQEKIDSSSLQLKPVVKEKQETVSASLKKNTAETESGDNITLHKAYKNRFDSSLEILLGADGRDKLYQEIDKLAAEGKIKFSEGTTREWYAHAFTMYDKIAPYSKENKAIKNLKQGGFEDAAYINSLVIKAERTGRGVKGSGSYSTFDNADKSIQQKHIHNCNQVQQALRLARAR